MAASTEHGILALYLRLSDEDDDLRARGEKRESNSIANQRTLLLEYYDAHPELHKLKVAEFCDDGFSGTNFERPQFQNMMEQVRQMEVKCIIVKDLSRFGRDYLEVGAYLELILPIFRTRFISVNDGFDSNDYLGTTGGMELALRNMINGLYSTDISEKIRSANRVRYKQGRYWGGGAFYGYGLDPTDKHKLVVDENVRDVILRIFTECADGRTMAEIARGLNEDGIPSPREYKRSRGQSYNGRLVEERAVWLCTTLRRILADERYTGKMVCGQRETTQVGSGRMRYVPREEWIIVKDTHEAIISDELFRQAAESRRNRIRTVNKNTAGRREHNLFVCGYCGRKLQKSRGKITRLFCPKARNVQDSACGDIHEDIEALQETALTAVRGLAKSLIADKEAAISRCEKEIPGTEQRLAQKQRRARFLQNNKLTLYEEYRQGQITKEQYLDCQAASRDELNDLEREIAVLCEEIENKKRAGKEAEKQIKSISDIKALKEYDPIVVGKLVRSIRVFPGSRIELELGCEDAIDSGCKSDDVMEEIGASAVMQQRCSAGSLTERHGFVWS